MPDGNYGSMLVRCQDKSNSSAARLVLDPEGEVFNPASFRPVIPSVAGAIATAESRNLLSACTTPTRAFHTGADAHFLSAAKASASYSP
jgi:hypothetical protein